ncbi:MAG: methyltransferase family protein [Thermocrispum sp.]
MTNDPVLLLIVLNYCGIGLLTAFFFRRDVQYTPQWWATALPHVLAPCFLVTSRVLGLDPLLSGKALPALSLAAVFLSAASLALMFFAWGTHRIPLAHFHQHDDAPVRLVTHGAYSRIRHPFYASYLLLYLAAAACFPHPVTALLFGYTLVTLTLTAAREEQRLSNSEFGAEYQQYLARSGRFFPRLAAPQPVD